MEIWKPVKDYEGLYEISNLGRIRSCDRIVSFGKQKRLSKGKILIQNTAGSNYNHIKLSKNNIVKRKYIHRLVCEAFIPNTENKPEINHINENKRDNRVENLEWVTKKENMNRNDIGKRVWEKAELHKYSGLNKKIVGQYKNGKLIKKYSPIKTVIDDGFKLSCIYDCLRGKSKHHKGYIWKYEETI